MSTSLAIDFGSKYIGIALVANEDGLNTPLFAGTLKYENFSLNKKVQPRAGIRRTRRTRKTKKARLHRLKISLTAIGIPADRIVDIIRFSKRRSYKSLWDSDEISEKESKQGEDEIV
ncbi:MAG: hypothetical protein EHM38_02870, partial [Geobacteraceae bacterium]